jgi:hypothetical protein
VNALLLAITASGWAAAYVGYRAARAAQSAAVDVALESVRREDERAAAVRAKANAAWTLEHDRLHRAWRTECDHIVNVLDRILGDDAELSDISEGVDIVNAYRQTPHPPHWRPTFVPLADALTRRN